VGVKVKGIDVISCRRNDTELQLLQEHGRILDAL
jgi:hypothetical protein